MEYKGYAITESQGHGKAGKGCKKTSTIQVTLPSGNGYLVKKQFGYPINDLTKKQEAIEKAKKYIDNL